MLSLIERPRQTIVEQDLQQQGLSCALLAQLYASRGIQTLQEVDYQLDQLLPFSSLRGCQEAAYLLADAIAQQERFCIVADYDCDGATACAVGVRGLHMMGAREVMTWVPDRIQDGYGLTPAIAQQVAQLGAQWLITVDNGIASIEGVQAAHELGLKVIITDHHLPANELPQADVIVNPQHPECPFESKALSGVGVMFYVIMALRAEARKRNWFDANTQPKLDGLLPLVALGTVADMVKLDANNRRLVYQGLERIRKKQAPVGIMALLAIAKRNIPYVATDDLGFFVAPRINAAGRLSDMSLGIECLITDDADRANALAETLEEINKQRKTMEQEMKTKAWALTHDVLASHGDASCLFGLTLFDEQFHEGIIGIVASRIKEALHRPTFVLARSAADQSQHLLKGSGRSIAGFHLRDALDAISKQYPFMFERFGGHAMAAGFTLRASELDLFKEAFANLAKKQIDPSILQPHQVHDGPLPKGMCQLLYAERLQKMPWGQGFATPQFFDCFRVLDQKVIGGAHLALKVELHHRRLEAICFHRTEWMPSRVRWVYRLHLSERAGVEYLQIIVVHVDENAGSC